MTIRPVLLILLAGLLLATPAWAQVTPALQLSSSAPRLSMGPNETQDVTLTARNTGTAAGTVTLTATTVPGWTIQVADPSFSLDGGATRTIRMTVKSSDASRNGTITVNGAIGYGTNQQGTPSSTQVALVYVAPAAPPPPPVPPSLVGPIIGIVAALALVAAALYLFQAMGVRLSVLEPDQTVVQGTPATYQIQVENRFGSPRTIELRVNRLDAPWAAAFSFPTVRLAGHEKTNVPLCVLPPIKAAPGDSVRFRIQARPNRRSPWLIGKQIGSRVVVLPKPGPADAVEAATPLTA